MTMPDVEHLLRQSALFSEMDEPALARLKAHARPHKFRKNTVLMSEGESGESVFVIESGSVRVFVSDEEGNQIVLSVEGPGASIGEISLLDGQPRTASAVTLEPTRVLVISKTDFMQCIDDDREVAYAIMRELTLRLRRSTNAIRSLALQNVYQRLAAKLLDLAKEPEGEDGVRVLPRRYSHQDLGNMIGASREMVGKIMGELVQGNYVELRDQCWALLKKLPQDR